jgi:N-acetylmuramoyl-L-alanine amidase
VNLRILFLVMALAGTACASGSKSDRNSAESSSTSASAAPGSSSTEASAATTGPAGNPSSTVATTGTTGAASSTTAKPGTTSPPASNQRVAAGGAFLAGERGAAVASDPGGKVTGRIRAGVAMAVDAIEGGWAHVLTPCENHLWVKTSDGRIEQTADIVLDPGHGGPEAGAVGPAGLTEKELNLAVAEMTVEALAAQGVTAALARTGDYRQTLASRVGVATAMHPKAFVSIHHNAEPDEQRAGPGTETYYQVGKSVAKEKSADSKRLAGLIYEEVVKALSAYSATWVADRDAGAKYRLGDSGDDYYGVLRRAAANGVVASLAELAFISNPSEEALLRRDDVRRAEAGAVARGIVRWLHNESPGNVFVVPYPRTEPAGGGGGTEGCVDPT